MNSNHTSRRLRRFPSGPRGERIIQMLDNKKISERNAELVRRIKADRNDGAAYRELIDLNYHMLGKMAASYKQPLEMNDLISEGIFGLITAVDRFDPDAGNSFMTYAYWHIKRYMNDYIRSLYAVHVPKGKIDESRKNGDEITNMQFALSLQTGKNLDLIDGVDRYLAAEKDAMDEFMENELQNDVRKAIQRLKNANERTALQLFYGIGCEKVGKEAISRILGISVQKVGSYIRKGREHLKKDPVLRDWYYLPG